MYRITLLLALVTFTISCSSTQQKDKSAEATSELTAPTHKVPSASETQSTKYRLKNAEGESVKLNGFTSYVCTQKDIRRELRVVKTPGGCKVEYTKDGAVQEIATGAANSQYCVNVVERVKNNLVTAGYTCK